YYIENETPNKDKAVYAIDMKVATVRYESKTKDNTPYQFTIDTNKTPELAGKWVTVTFYIRTGVESKKYRLELWSGSRDNETDYEGATKDSYVVFDYSGLGASLDDSKFTAALDEYTKLITDDYKSKITDELESNDLTIAELEKLASEEIKNEVKADYDYTAKHYSFSLFDSTAFIPFNGETADENQTGYSFNYSDYDESLAYLKIVDDSDENNITFSSFIDYSVVDKDFDIIGAPQLPDDSADDDHNHDDDNGDANFWLLIASIVLVAAIMLAAAVIFIRSVVLKRIRRKTAGKNSYNFNKNKRYVKKYVKANGEAPAIEEGEVDESLLSDQPEEAVEAEPATEETVEEPAVEDTPSEGGEEKTDDGNDDGENK
ncbi:MAG: hypothetical protein K2O67_06175, partial [Clostridia bacterium]|nr:hypothetical protein [Clostridia bacterium]